MFANHKPAHVRKEKTSFCIVRVSHFLTALVVSPVVPTPDIDRVLPSHRVCNGQNNFERELGFVSFVRPEPMSSHGDASSRKVLCKQKKNPHLQRQNWQDLWDGPAQDLALAGLSDEYRAAFR